MRSLFGGGTQDNSDNQLSATAMQTGLAGRLSDQHPNELPGRNVNFNTRGKSEMSQSIERGYLEATSLRSMPSRSCTYLMAALAAIALSISGYLAFTSLTSGTIAGCSGSLFDCNSVLKSRWSNWFGVPVSLLASVTYIGLLSSLAVTLWGTSRQRSLAWLAVATLSISAGLAAIWFISLQVFVLHHLCKYCLAAHGCGLCLAGIVLFRKSLGTVNVKIPAFVAMAGFAVLVLGQSLGPAPKTYTIETYESVSTPVESSSGEVFGTPEDEGLIDGEFAPPEDDFIFEPPQESEVSSFIQHPAELIAWLSQPSVLTGLVIYEPQEDDDSASAQSGETESAQSKAKPEPKPRRFVSIQGNMKLEVNRWPMIGNPDAKYVFVELFDYSCPHCRRTHQTAIKGAQQKMPEDLAVITLPIPLNTRCNKAITQTGPKFSESCEIANLAVAVWKVDKKKFQEFHNWMFSGNAPSFAQAKKHAESLVDKDKLAQVLKSKLPSSYIGRHVQIYERAGKGNVPKLMFPRRAIVGEFTSADALIGIVEEEGETPMATVANE